MAASIELVGLSSYRSGDEVLSSVMVSKRLVSGRSREARRVRERYSPLLNVAVMGPVQPRGRQMACVETLGHPRRPGWWLTSAGVALVQPTDQNTRPDDGQITESTSSKVMNRSPEPNSANTANRPGCHAQQRTRSGSTPGTHNWVATPAPVTTLLLYALRTPRLM